MRVSTILYKMTSCLGLLNANAVSTFPINPRDSCLFPLNCGTSFKAFPTLITSSFILEPSLLAVLRQLELGRKGGAWLEINWVKTHPRQFDVPELLLLQRYATTPELTVSALSLSLSLSRTLDRRCRLSLEPWTASQVVLASLLSSSQVHATVVLNSHLTPSNYFVSGSVPVENVLWILLPRWSSKL
jgi:hypothetical protein